MGSPRPRAESEFVEDVLVALKKRGKSLKQHNARPEVNRWLELIDDEKLERVEIHFERRNRQTLTLIVWSDRMVEVLASGRNSDESWKFRFTVFARALGETDGRVLIAAVESTLALMYRLNQDELGPLEQVWSPLLAQSPQGI